MNEWIIFLVILFGVSIIIRLIAKKYKLKILFVVVCCISIREIVYILGHDKAWAVEIDNEMLDWAFKKMGETGGGRKHPMLKKVFVLAPVVIYFLAVFVDLSVAGRISEEYLGGAENIKTFFLQLETMLSKGYEQYPPLFVQAEEYEDEREPIHILLNDRGKSGSNLRSEADLSDKGNIIGIVNKDSEILYRDEWVYDGERYWIRVYVPAKDLEGWLSGKLVDSEQLAEIVEGKTE